MAARLAFENNRKHGHKSLKQLIDHPALLLTELEKNRTQQASSIKFRRDLIESQKRSNYVNEYDRLKGSIEQHTLQGLRSQHLRNRQKELKNLAKESIYPSKHEIYKQLLKIFFIPTIY